jgi:hypothetical protein
MPSFLPILIPGRTEPVNVPCSLPDSWTFDVFLPDRGIRKVAVFWKSSDPLQIDYCETALANPETDIAHFLCDPYLVDQDEDQRMQDAAGDVLEAVLIRMDLSPTSRKPGVVRDAHLPLQQIARAFLAECRAFEAVLSAHTALPRAAGCIATIGDPSQGAAHSVGLLQRYVQWCVDEACKAQDAKALKESTEHLSSALHPEDRALPPWCES